MTARGALPVVRCSCRLLLSLPDRLRRLPKQEVATLSSADSPILSRVEAELCPGESPEKREGEPERICSLADKDQEGRIPFSLLTAKGLVTEEREDRLWRWTLRTKGRVEKPPVEGRGGG